MFPYLIFVFLKIIYKSIYMNQYYQFPNKERKPSTFKKLYYKIFPDKKVKPITFIKSNQITPSEFYEKYGIIYDGSTTRSCVNSIF